MNADDIAITITHPISILSCLFLFYYYFKLPAKSLALKMIFTLGISDFFFHVPYLAISWFPDDDLNWYLSQIIGYAARFSLFWSLNMAYILYRLFTMKGTPDFSKYYKYSLIFLLIFNFLLGLCYIMRSYIDSSTFDYIIVLIPFASIIVTAYYYLRCRFILKKCNSPFLEASNEIVKVLCSYVLVQVLAIGPNVVYDIFGDPDDILSQTIADTCNGLTGFANCLVYFMQRKTTDKTSMRHSNLTLASRQSFYSDDGQYELVEEY